MTNAIVVSTTDAASNARLSHRPGVSRYHLAADDTSQDWMNTLWPTAAQNGIATFDGSWLLAWAAFPQPNLTAAVSPAATGSATLTQVLYLQEAGDTAAISVNDIHQGQIGDCYLLSSIGELALFHPSWITQMIRVNTDGTETVTLYTTTANTLPGLGATSFKPVAVTVTNDFPTYCVNNGATQDVLNGQKEIWVQVLEKAVATLYGGYAGIAYGGIPSITMEELTGCTANYNWSTSLTLQQLQGAVAAGDLITFDTKGSGTLSYNLVNSHAYMFSSLSTVNGTVMVNLLNPWGTNEPAAIPFSQVSALFDGIDIGHFSNAGGALGSAGNDNVTLSAVLVNGFIDLLGGNDTLTLANGLNSATIANVETIIGGTGNDTIILSTVASGSRIDLGGGIDSLTLANGGNVLTVANVETIIGGTGNDTVTLASVLTAATSVDLGAGNDMLILSAGASGGTVNNTETIIGCAGNDTVVLGTAMSGGTVDLGAGNDTLRLANGTNTASIASTETIYGGSGIDTITLTTAISQAYIDLGAGSDKLVLGNFNNTATISNVETIIGGSGADTITLASALTSTTSIDLGAGNDTLRLANGTSIASIANTGTINNVETIIGGSGNDTITLGTSAINATIDLGGGANRLTLGAFSNSVTVANTQTIVGGSGSDTIVLTGSVGATVIGGGGINFITGGAGADTFVLDQASTNAYSMISNFGTSDRIALDVKGIATFGTDIYNLGGAALADGRTITKVADATGRLAAWLNNGSGAFVYQQNTGALYYSANGNFSVGGVEIGMVTTNGATAWTYDASKFVAV